VATAPGKVMLAGEYAVLDGGPAVLAAVDRRAVARSGARAGATLSPFLAAARDVVRAVLGDDAARCFDGIDVDTGALAQAGQKLGLGSSAAATVAAVRLAGGEALHDDLPLVIRLALDAHARAQAGRGAAGSGADVVAVAHGGVIGFRSGAVRRLALPDDLQLRFAWTGTPADTATLVARVQAARPAAAVDDALTAIAAAATALDRAGTAAAAIAALAAGATALQALATATGVDLVPPALALLATRLAPLGAVCKTTGAGGGDVIVIAAPTTVGGGLIDTAIVEAGMWPLQLAVDPRGVDFHPDGG
jgi:phosphomevalonate kinase